MRADIDRLLTAQDMLASKEVFYPFRLDQVNLTVEQLGKLVLKSDKTPETPGGLRSERDEDVDVALRAKVVP